MEEYSVYNETDDMFEGEDISPEEFPDFVQQFAEKQDLQGKRTSPAVTLPWRSI